MTQLRPPSADPAPAGSRHWLLIQGARGALLVLALAIAASAFAAAVYRVVQKGRTFSVSEITIAPSDTVQFTNEDEFLHQIYVDSELMNFDSNEQPPGQTIEVRFPVRGTFPVRCHIHPKMLLFVHVQ